MTDAENQLRAAQARSILRWCDEFDQARSTLDSLITAQEADRARKNLITAATTLSTRARDLANITLAGMPDLAAPVKLTVRTPDGSHDVSRYTALLDVHEYLSGYAQRLGADRYAANPELFLVERGHTIEIEVTK